MVADQARAAAIGERPAPDVAYAQWIDVCTRAGWRIQARPERVPVADCLGRVTADPIRADRPSPWFDCAAMDGIAVRAGAGAGAGHDRDRNSGGSGRWRLAPADFAWVDTGEPMPAGTDTVVECERVNLDGDGSAWITGPAPRGLHVRAVGEDFPAGQLLIPARHRLRPPDLAAAVAAGHAALDVACRPAVTIIPTGNEIRPIGSALRTGEITDSNSPMLAALVTESGGTPLVSDVQPDDAAEIATAVTQAARHADLVLLVAGSSTGHRDQAPAVLADTGGIAVHGVAVRPGHPALLGYTRPAQPGGRPADGPAGGSRPVPVIGVPGYPLAAVVIFELFATRLLAALQGCSRPERPRQHAQLACKWTSSPDVEDWVPVSLATGPAGLDTRSTVLATPIRRGAGAISQLVRADAWWTIPAGRAEFSCGEQIDVQPIPGAPAGLGSDLAAPARQAGA
ncbi:MAG TPA: molybdopterin molybdotransferase MoeA [Streptosporangiaceae bacterium]|nr:molybdopterin molybdotransferase MoeA [Streptosporangiaceae bacterium]